MPQNYKTCWSPNVSPRVVNGHFFFLFCQNIEISVSFSWEEHSKEDTPWVSQASLLTSPQARDESMEGLSDLVRMSIPPFWLSRVLQEDESILGAGVV